MSLIQLKCNVCGSKYHVDTNDPMPDESCPVCVKPLRAALRDVNGNRKKVDFTPFLLGDDGRLVVDRKYVRL